MSSIADNTTSSSRSSYVAPYALPNASEVGDEDDWTHIKDRKEKKRIQNRVAQRTYRHRIKSRLTELQNQLNSQNGNLGLSTENDKPLDTPSGRAHNSLTDNQQLPVAVAEPQWQKVSEKDRLQPQRQNLHEQAMDDSRKTAFVRNKSHLQAAPNVQPFSQPQVMFRDEESNQNEKAYDMLLPDSMRLPKQLRNISNTQQEQAIYSQVDSHRDNMTLSSETMGRASQVNKDSLTTPEESDSMDNFFDIPIDTWKSNTFSPTMSQTPLTTGTLDSTAPLSHAYSLAQMIDTAVDSDSDMSDLPAKDAPLEERFEFIMECIMATGLDNFDKLVTTYYVETFKESSPLANEQRLSRNRRLPKVIADLFCATKEWSTWERWGFHEEILKTTETMLISENSKARSAVDAGIAPLLKAQNVANTAHADHAILVLKKKIPDELPNLWALMMALTAPDKGMWQQDCSSKALATILLLHCAGRIPNEQLLDLIGACL